MRETVSYSELATLSPPMETLSGWSTLEAAAGDCFSAEEDTHTHTHTHTIYKKLLDNWFMP